MNKILTILILSFSCTVALHAGDVIDYRNLLSRQSLGSSNISAMAKDANGFVWLATHSELVRFDGTSYFDPGPQVNERLYAEDNFIQRLYFRDPDILWICSNNGLFRYDIRRHEFSEPLSGIRVNTLDMRGDSLLLNTNKGIILYMPGSGTTETIYDYADHLGGAYPRGYTSVASDATGGYWVMAERNLLKLPSPQEMIRMKGSGHKIIADTVAKYSTPKRMAVDQYNMIWLWDRETLTTARISPARTLGDIKESQTEITALLMLDGRVLQGERGKGYFSIIRNDRGEKISRKHFLLNRQYDDLGNTANVFMRDGDGNIWIGTRDGLFMIPEGRRNKFYNIRNDVDTPNTLSTNTVSSIMVEGRNTVWIGTAYGLNRLSFSGTASDEYTNKRFFDTRSSINYVLDNKIESITTDSEGIMWLGTKGNLKFYNPRTNTYLTKPAVERELRSCSFVMALITDRDGDIWIGYANGGIFVYDHSGGHVAGITTQNGIPANCTTLAEGNNGVIWAGTKDSGVMRIEKSVNGLSIKPYPIHESTYGKRVIVNYLHADKHNNIWAGTTDGLYKYNYEKDDFVAMPLEFSGRPRYIAGLIDDDRGNLWIASTIGIYKYNISEGTSRFIPLNNGNFVRQGFVFGCDIDSDGIIYMSGINGLTYFNPNDIVSDTSSHRVRFTDFRVHNRSLLPGSGVLGEDINYARSITLRHKDNQISFSFSALSYANRDDIRYSYMLEGVDEEWVYTGCEERYTSYGNLPAGRYKLKIRSTDATGEWLDNVTSLSIRVKPSVSGSWYFIILYVLAFACIIWMLMYLFMLRARLRLQKNLENHKLKFYTDLSYSIKTPLTLLKSPLKNIIDHYDAMSDDEKKYMLGTMQGNGNRLSLIVDQLVEFRKVSQGKARLHLTESDFISFARDIYDNFKALFASKGIEFFFSTNVDRLLLVFDRAKMETVLFNLLSNAFKFTHNGGRVELRCHEDPEDHRLWVEVTDNGTGLKADDKDKVFERFWTDGSQQGAGVGIGLNLSRELVELHKGTIEIEGAQDKGTQVCFYLLTGKSHFGNVELEEIGEEPDRRDRLKDYVESELETMPGVADHLPDAALIYMTDEDKQIPEFVSKVFRPGLKVVAFDNPESLYEEVVRKKPAIILSAVVFDGVKRGLELCNNIKSNPDTNDIPFVFVTAYSSDEDKKVGYEAGADAYITKPFDVNHLKKRVTILLQAQRNIMEKVKREFIVNPKEVQAMSADDKFLFKCMEVIEKNIAVDNFTVDGFASKMHLSTSMLYRKIKNLTNLSPNELIKSVRLKRAAQLLSTKAYTISEVAVQVGFVDIRYFSTCFKKEYGIPPSAYQQGSNGDNI